MKWTKKHLRGGFSSPSVTYGMQWFDAVDKLLNVATYEDVYFEIPMRLSEAQQWSADNGADPDHVSHLWCERVRLWASNLQRDLRDDGVPRPGSAMGSSGNERERWMLYQEAVLDIDGSRHRHETSGVRVGSQRAHESSQITASSRS